MKFMQYTFMLAGLLMLGLIACQSPTAQVVEKETPSTEKMKDKSAKAVKASLDGKTLGYQVGDKASDFSLKGIDGNMHSLAGIADAQGYIVTFTCNHCPYAVMYEDRLIDLHKKYEAKGYPIVAINPNDPAAQPEDSFEKMKDRSDEKDFPFLYLFDDGQKVYPAYGATRTPHIFLLDKDLTVKYIGAIDDNPRDASAVKTKYLENAIDALMTGTEPDPNFTKAIGCSIKTKKS